MSQTPTESAAKATTPAAPPTRQEDRLRIPASEPPPGPHVLLRLALGLVGLTLLVGFFLPWYQPSDEEPMVRGLDLALGTDLVGSPSGLLWLIPGLGAALSIASFMGFRYAGQASIGVALLVIGYSLYVVLRMFVTHTAVGLWVVAGGTFTLLLLGVLALVLGRRAAEANR